MIDTDRLGNVLQLLVTQILEREIKTVSDVVVNHFGDGNAAGRGHGLDPRRDIDPVSIEVTILSNDVAQVNPDAELDLLVVRGDRRWGFECKYADAPRTTRSMRAAVEDLGLERLFVLYPGEKDYALDERIQAMAFGNVARLGVRSM